MGDQCSSVKISQNDMVHYRGPTNCNLENLQNPQSHLTLTTLLYTSFAQKQYCVPDSRSMDTEKAICLDSSNFGGRLSRMILFKSLKKDKDRVLWLMLE